MSGYVLVVDDEVGIRDLLLEILTEEGYDVHAAENAEEARRYRAQQRPDLVLLDIWMPDTDGVTLLKEWASSGQLTMPVVMMSGHATIDTEVEATKLGIPLLVNSDAHGPEQVGTQFAEMKALLLKNGCRQLARYERRQRQLQAL